MRLLLRHAEYCRLLADTVSELAKGNPEAYQKKREAMAETFGRHEFELERYFDHYLCMKNLDWAK
jgi:hypothetical protein